MIYAKLFGAYPACGALMQHEPEKDSMVCEYCGTEVIFEVSEEERKQRMAKKLAGQVDQYRENLAKLNSFNDSVKQIDTKLTVTKKALESAPTTFIGGSILFGAISAIFAFLSLSEGESPVLFLGILPVIGIIALIITKVKPAYVEKKTAEKIKLEGELKTAIENRKNTEEAFDIDFIAPDYRQDDILAFLSKTFHEERAFSLQQAYNAYTDKKEADRQDQQRKEELEELKRIKQEGGPTVVIGGKDIKSDLAKGALMGGAAMLGGAVAKDVIKGAVSSKTAQKVAKDIAKQFFR